MSITSKHISLASDCIRAAINKETGYNNIICTIIVYEQQAYGRAMRDSYSRESSNEFKASY